MQDPAVIDRLNALVVALDRRQPQPARPEEAAIARDASEMRGKAVAKLAELQAAPPVADV